jgi:hypothetical protein
MAYYLPSSPDPDGDPPPAQVSADSQASDISDLKIFWGPEICRLEYLVHLMETGRIVDECGGVKA